MATQDSSKRMVLRGRGGKTINIGSLTSQAARRDCGALHSGQGRDQNAFARLAAEWAQFNIQANTIGPGYIATGMNEAYSRTLISMHG